MFCFLSRTSRKYCFFCLLNVFFLSCFSCFFDSGLCTTCTPTRTDRGATALFSTTTPSPESPPSQKTTRQEQKYRRDLSARQINLDLRLVIDHSDPIRACPDRSQSTLFIRFPKICSFAEDNEARTKISP